MALIQLQQAQRQQQQQQTTTQQARKQQQTQAQAWRPGLLSCLPRLLLLLLVVLMCHACWFRWLTLG
jgi:hypothetical protein